MAVYKKGADPEVLERVAREITASASQLSGIRDAGTTAFAAIVRAWGGADAHRAHGDWKSTAIHLETLGARLEDLARKLEANARSQRGTSGESGTIPGLPGFPGLPGVPGFPGIPGLPGVPAGPPESFSDSVRGTKPQDIDLELAELADNVYHPSETGEWSPLTDDELTALGIDPDSLTGPGGFASAVYRTDDGRYVLAYAGTDPTSVSDWATNAQQGTGGLSAQHIQAIQLAQKLEGAVGSDNLVLTGHSLGGGLAGTASAATGLPGVTFNASGVHPNTLIAAAAMGDGSFGVPNDQVRNYHIKGEALTTIQNPLGSFIDHVPFIGDNPLPNAVGTQIAIDPAEGPDVHVSKWSYLSPAALVIDAGEDLVGYSVNQHKSSSVVDALEASEYFGKH